MIYQPEPQLGTPYIPGHPLGPSGGLVADWLFNTPRSDMLYERTKNRRHGTLMNAEPATDWVSSQWGPALDLDGSNEYVRCPNIDPDYVTVVAWVRGDTNAGSRELIACQDDRWALRWNHAGGVDKPAFIGKVSGGWATAYGSLQLTNGSYHMLAGTFDGGTVRFYLDGIEDGSAVRAGTLDANTGYVHLGIHANGAVNPFDGLYIRAMIYDCAKTAPEILQLAADRYCMFEPETKPAWWWDAMVAPPPVGTPYYYNWLNRLWGETA